jgi:hypothetical protein
MCDGKPSVYHTNYVRVKWGSAYRCHLPDRQNNCSALAIIPPAESRNYNIGGHT